VDRQQTTAVPTTTAARLRGRAEETFGGNGMVPHGATDPRRGAGVPRLGRRGVTNPAVVGAATTAIRLLGIHGDAVMGSRFQPVGLLALRGLDPAVTANHNTVALLSSPASRPSSVDPLTDCTAPRTRPPAAAVVASTRPHGPSSRPDDRPAPARPARQRSALVTPKVDYANPIAAQAISITPAYRPSRCVSRQLAPSGGV